MSKNQFSNRWGIVLAALGMAIGAGNLWRFPRLAGQYGGSFIILWIVFLFIWSIPLLLSEFAIGKKFKNGVIGSFSQFAGKKFAWMGFFITVCTLGIAFYYSVVTAWAFRYLSFSVNQLFSKETLNSKLATNPEYLNNFWVEISTGNLYTVAVFAIVICLGIFILYRGVQTGLERANKLLIPSLFVLLIFIVIVSLNLEGGIKGLEYMFTVDPKAFGNPTIWIEAVSQSAWSTGAGWGLMMTLSAYTRENEDVTLNTFIGAFGNNTASLLAAMAILPAVFGLSATEAEAINHLKAGNQSLTFTIIPMLFASVPGGEYMAVLFFLALFVAAFSSFLPMIELFLLNIRDLRINMKYGLFLAIAVFFLFGLPSALSLEFFSNQDWVWGVGLIVTGLFILIGVAYNNPIQFKESLIDNGSDIKLPNWFFISAILGNIFLGFFLIYWWLSQDYSANWLDKDGNWNLWGTYSNASTLTQWGLIILIGLVFNNYLHKKFVNK